MALPAPASVDAAGIPPLGDQATNVLSGSFAAVGPTAPFAFRGPMNLALWGSINTALTTTAGSLSASVASATGLAAGAAINSVNVPFGTTIGALSGTAVTLALPPITIYGTLNPSNARISGLASTTGLVGATVTVPSIAENSVIPAGTTILSIIQAAVPATNISPGTPGIALMSASPTSVVTTNQPIALQFAQTGNAITASGADSKAIFTGAAVTYSGTVQVERSFDGGATFLCCNVGGSGQLAQYTAGTPINITFGEPEKQVLYRLNCTIYTSGTANYRISQTGGAAESLAIGPLSGG